MSESQARQRVYAWVTDEWNPSAPPRSLPAVRLWGDVILEVVAESRREAPRPPISIRSKSIFAWPDPLPPEPFADATAGRRRVELLVAAPECAVARIDVVHELFDPVMWRRLREWLGDRGYARDFVEEDVVPFAEPRAAMLVEGARHAVESTSTELLGEILSYFHPVANRYLDSWVELSDIGDVGPSMEIIIPPSAIAEIVD